MDGTDFAQLHDDNPGLENVDYPVVDIRRREAALQEIWQLMTDIRLEWAIWPNGH